MTVQALLDAIQMVQAAHTLSKDDAQLSASVGAGLYILAFSAGIQFICVVGAFVSTGRVRSKELILAGGCVTDAGLQFISEQHHT